MSPFSTQVLPLRMLVANAYVLKGERAVIVDTGTPGKALRILRRLARHGIRPRDVSLILLTHGHLDHFGSALELREQTGAPIAIHRRDAGALRLGHNPPLKPVNATARLLRPFFQHRVITPFEPDLLIDDDTQLDVFGVSGRVISTPGHTAGSVSVLLAGGELIAGDLLMGGYLGGYLLPGVAGYPYFLNDREMTRVSIAAILELPLTTVYVGHGGPLHPAAIRKHFAAIAGLRTQSSQRTGTY